MTSEGLAARKPAGGIAWSPAVLCATPLRRALIVTSLWRLGVAVWGIAAHGLLKGGPTASQTLTRHGWPSGPLTYLVDAGVREDAWWYARVATHGYAFSTRHVSSIVFYPLYPLLIKAVSLVAGNVFVAGMLISTACLFLGVWMLQRWLDLKGLGSHSPMTVALMLCYPFGFFWASMYNESLFLVLALATFVLFEQRRWVPASACVFFAVLTRPTGLILAPCLAVMILARWKRFSRDGAANQPPPGPELGGAQPETRNQKLVTHDLTLTTEHESQPFRLVTFEIETRNLLFLPWLAVSAAPLAFLLFALYQWLTFGTPFASIRAEAVPPFSRSFSSAVSDLLLRRHGFPPWFLAFMLVIAVIFLALVPLVYRRFGLPYALFAALVVLFPLTSGLTSMERYVMIDFPVFAAVASVRWKIVPVAVCVVAFYVMLGFMALFISGYTLI